MMGRRLVIGDIHGGLRALIQVFDRIKISEADSFIFLGDYTDGWSEVPQVIDFLQDLSEKHSCVFIRGNHDVMLCDYLETGMIMFKDWDLHGGGATKDSYKNISLEVKKKHIQFLQNLQNYYIDEKNRLFVHAGFSHIRGIKEEYDPSTCYWDRTLWEMAVCLDDKIPQESVLYPKRLKIYSEIFVGHTPTLYINSAIPTQKANIWNVDTGAAFKGKLSVLDIDTKEFWQSDAVNILYPNEKGRN